MANRLIDELIINVRQRGAPAVERQLGRIVDTLEDSAVGAELLRNELESLPRVLRDVEQSANRATSSLRGALDGGLNSDAVEASLAEISESLLTLIDQSNDTTQAIDNLSTESVSAIDRMANSLGADLERIEDNLIDTTRASERTAEGLQNVGRSGRTAATGANQHARGLANQTRQGRNSARTLSDLVNISGPLVNAYAAVAANIFAVSEALRLLVEGSAINRLESLGDTISANIGTPIGLIAENIREASGGVLSLAESLRQATAASAFGFNQQQIEELTVVARRASVALGQDFTDALNRAIRGTSKLEVELLDELGITARLTTAYERYAAAIGVSADSLNAYQQRLALVNEVTRQSELQLGFLDEQLQGLPWEQAATNARNAFDSIIQSISSATEPVANLINALSSEGVGEGVERRLGDILGQITEARAQGNQAGIVGGLRTLQDFETSLQNQIRQNEIIAQQNPYGSQAFAQALNNVNALRRALGGVQDISTQVFTESGLSPQQIRRSADSYDALRGAVRGAAADLPRLLSGARGNNSAAEQLANTSQTLVEVYTELQAANPYVDLTQDLQRLGFESEAELTRTRDLTRNFADATAASQAFAETQARIALEGTRSGALGSETTLRTLEARLNVERSLLEAQRGLGVQSQVLARSQSQVLSTERQILEARVASVNAEFNQAAETRALLFREVNLGQVETLRQTVALEQGRISRLEMIEGSTLAIEEAQRRIRDTELQIQDIENQRIRNNQNAFLQQAGVQSRVGLDQETLNQQDIQVAAQSFNQALSQLTAQNPGLETLFTNINALSASFNNLGETSLNATQLTTVGLNAFSGLLQNVSAQSIASIDAQIQAERNRDGQSQQSLAKIRALEAQKIREQRKAAQQQILISTAVAVMNAAANPWPVPALPLMAAAALAGGLALNQANSASSNQLASLNSTQTQTAATLSVGERDNRVNVQSSASAGELSFIRGETGTGNINSFTPRAAGGIGTPGLSFLVGENGPELITPMQDLQVSDTQDTMAAMQGGGSEVNFNFSVQALDSQSFMDRAPDIFEAFNSEAEQRGIDLSRIG